MASIEFKVHINKLGNLFSLVNNLAEWHFSCNSELNDYWLEQTGPLTPQEKVAIANLKILLKDLGFSRWPGYYLIGQTPQTATKNIQIKYSKKELEILNTALRTFEPRFQNIWKAEAGILRDWETQFNKSNKQHGEISNDLESFFGRVKINVKSLHVYPLIGGISTMRSAGANLGPGKLHIRVPVNFASLPSDIPTIWHECIHIIYGGVIRAQIKGFLEQNQLEPEILALGFHGLPENFLNEGVVYSLLPQGYLGYKHFGANLFSGHKGYNKWVLEKEPDVYRALHFMSNNGGCMFKIARKYIEASRRLDEEYMQQIHQSYLSYLKLVRENAPK